MLYRVVLVGLAAPILAQNCASTDAGTDACACYMMQCADVTTMGTPVSMTTTLGPVTGRLQDGVERYFGVPTAASSAGANRFKPPQALASWTTAVETTVEHMCPQAAYPVGGTENCLMVDVLKPTGLSNLPAAMWVHGGGFTGQNPFFNHLTYGSWQKYSFSMLPNGGKVVTVLAHYRLGALGWMAHPGFEDGSTFSTFGTVTGSGNYGMSDTISHIQWIVQNAAGLGVDSTKVNVFGESAGAAHVTMLIASPLTQGMVASFVAQSPFISFGDATFSYTARKEMGLLWTLRTGCTTSAVVSSGSTATTEASCLRAAPIVDLISDVGFAGTAGGGLASSTTAVATFDAVYGTGAAGLFTYNSIHCWPTVDGLILTHPPLQAYAAGINSGASIIIGHNADEYATFCYSPPFAPALGSWVCGTAPDIWNEAWVIGIYYLGVDASYAQIVSAVTTANTGSKMAQLKAGLFYSDLIDSVQMMSIQMGTDAWFANGNQMSIEALLMQGARTDGTVYHYVFGQDTDPGVFSLMGACHGCELTYILGFYLQSMTFLSSQLPASTGLQSATISAGSTAVGNAMTYYWATMWYYGTPNIAGNGLPTWSPMLAGDKQTMAFSGDFPLGAMMNPCVRWSSCRTEQVKDYRMAQKHFWNSAPAAIPLASPTCTSAPAAFYSHQSYATIGLSCTFLPCCTYTSTGRRNLLFGMPASSSSGSCDPAC